MALWETCHGNDAIQSIAGTLTRVVECQEQIATNHLVDTLEEQSLLEQLLETTKPHCPKGCERLHYLLSTPFRYPPLRNGSRFGTRLNAGIFYAALSLPTALAETGYYRLLFWAGMESTPPSGKLTTQHTVFQAEYASEQGIKLQCPPFNAYTDILKSPRDYTSTQALGHDMYKAGIEGFEYISARDPKAGLNIALLSPAALISDRPAQQEYWLCETSAGQACFYSGECSTVYTFPVSMYQVGNEFPAPP